MSGISKPMFWQSTVCMPVAFQEKARNHENVENDEENSDGYEQGIECWICENYGNHGHDENHRNPGCKPQVSQTTALEILYPTNLTKTFCVVSPEDDKEMAPHNWEILPVGRRLENTQTILEN